MNICRCLMAIFCIVFTYIMDYYLLSSLQLPRVPRHLQGIVSNQNHDPFWTKLALGHLKIEKLKFCAFFHFNLIG